MGEKLWILDDLVLDLSKFKNRHFGGSFLIERTVGRDVSKFFYGGYSLDNNSNNPGKITAAHSHTNIARIIANKLAIAVLDRSNTPHFEAIIDDDLTMDIN
jgi:cytochrome b involved in lipid metabolism